MIDAIQEDVSQPLNIDSAAAKILAMDVPPEEELSEEESETVEADASTEDSEESEETSDVDASGLSELSEYLSENKDAYDQIEIPTKVNGKEGKATLSEILRAYQIGESVDQKSDSLSAERKEFESLKDQATSEIGQNLEQAKGLVMGLEQQFLKEFQEIDWNSLREADPAEFSAKRQELLERQAGLNNVKNSIVQHQQQSMAENFKQHISQQQKLLPELIPEWSDEKTAKSEQGELRDYLLSQGVPKEAIDGRTDANGNVISPGISDALSIMLARKAMMYDKGAEKVNVARKKVRKVPKVARPGKAASKSELDDETTKKKRGKLKKTGRLEDAASLIYDKMYGGQ